MAPGSNGAPTQSFAAILLLSMTHLSLFLHSVWLLSCSLQPLPWLLLSSCGDIAICKLPCSVLAEKCWFVKGLHVTQAILELPQASLEFFFTNLKGDFILLMISFINC